jgi:tetratricopeptide (TPR) repeat protein
VGKYHLEIKLPRGKAMAQITNKMASLALRMFKDGRLAFKQLSPELQALADKQVEVGLGALFFFGRGLGHERAGENESALECYRQAIQGCEVPGIHLALARASLRSGFHLHAIRSTETALEKAEVLDVNLSLQQLLVCRAELVRVLAYSRCDSAKANELAGAAQGLWEHVTDSCDPQGIISAEAKYSSACLFTVLGDRNRAIELYDEVACMINDNAPLRQAHPDACLLLADSIARVIFHLEESKAVRVDVSMPAI